LAYEEQARNGESPELLKEKIKRIEVRGKRMPFWKKIGPKRTMGTRVKREGGVDTIFYVRGRLYTVLKGNTKNLKCSLPRRGQSTGEVNRK